MSFFPSAHLAANEDIRLFMVKIAIKPATGIWYPLSICLFMGKSLKSRFYGHYLFNFKKYS